MRPSFHWILLAALAFCTLPIPPTHAAPKATPSPAPSSWSKNMRDLETSLQSLLADVSSDERYNNKKNFARIESSALRFSRLAHDVSRSKAAPDADPSLALIGGLFSKQADHAVATLKSGHRAYARDLLRSMMSYCIACHTRNSAGPQFRGIELKGDLADLKPLEKANYFVATRQFDSAMGEYERVLSNSAMASRQPFDWASALRSGIAIAVRVKKDPGRALALLTYVKQTEGAPFYLREQAASWKRSLEQWQEELPRQPKTEEGFYAEAVRLIALAKSTQNYPNDHAADVIYLRASSMVHELLALAPQGAHAAEAYYMAGLAYGALQNSNLWDIDEFYYLACIRQSPNSQISQQCYQNYEERVYFGFSGSGGTFIPEEEKERLKELRKLALPIDPQLKAGLK